MSLLWAVTLLSAAVLGFEVLLMRLFSIEQWHHFAYMIISLALLGYGASGTFLSFFATRLKAGFPRSFAVSAALFGVAAPAAFAIARRVPLNSLEIVWDRQQQLFLVVVFVILAVPFFFAATGIGLALAQHRERIGLVYRSDLVGAGLGALGIVTLLFFLSPAGCLRLISGMGLAAAALASWDFSLRRTVPAALLAAAVLLPAAWPAAWLTPQPSPYKDLSLALRVPGAEVIAERAGPLGQLTVVRNRRIPFRHAPGLSLNAVGELPEQVAVFTDGGGMTAITRFDGSRQSIAYLDQQSAALPFHLLERPRVLVLGAGGGADVLLARFHGARTIDAVELNPQMVDLVRRDFAGFAGGVFEVPGVRVHVAEARSFVAASRDRFDLVHVALLDSFSTAAAGLHAVNESTLYTLEALQAYLEKLAPGGFLAITRWLKLPPRDSLKLFDTARKALGTPDPGRSLAMIRSWRTSTLLVKNGVITPGEVSIIADFCRQRSFDMAHVPGMTADAANRYNILDRPYLYEGATALLGGQRQAFLDRYKFDLTPSTDDRPYFFHFLKWRTLSELVHMRGGGGLPLVEWGYLILLATLVQAVVAGTVLILVPLAALRRQSGPGRRRGAVMVYFLALGLAFLFIEIASIQRFVLFLGHPIHAVAVVLSGFLVFAGLGSGFARRFDANAGRSITGAVAGIVLVVALYLGGLSPLLEWLRPLPELARIGATLLLIAPLAFFMGMPFPLGLARTAAATPELVPWAWGINGCASVLSSVLAAVLAIHFGFTAVMVFAVALYGLAALVFAGRG